MPRYYLFLRIEEHFFSEFSRPTATKKIGENSKNE
jgi:hypothetical protein